MFHISRARLRRAVQSTMLLLLASTFAFPSPALGAVGDRSSDLVWVEVDETTVTPMGRGAFGRPAAYRVFQMDPPALNAILSRTPLEAPGVRGTGVTLTLPMPDGTFQAFRVEESPLLSPELQARYPDIRTYIAQGIDDPTATVRLDLTLFGFRAQVLSVSGTVLVDPYQLADTGHYMSYWKRDFPTDGLEFQCDVEGLSRNVSALPVPSGSQLRTYRMVVTATGEYTTFLGGMAQAQAQITTTFNRVTGIFERDVAVRFNVTDTIIYTDAGTDPFPTGASVNGDLLDQNQTNTDAVIGSGNYDIGHIVSQGGSGGLASVNATCNNARKARGGTSRATPSGDPFDVDFVAHEVGHQMGGRHSFNGTTSSCGGGNRNAGTAYEPGSGTTIMAYAGICGAENVQANSDAYFHVVSLDEIIAYRNGGGACGTVANTGNSPPNVNAGANFTIPRDTPFRLTASGSDADGDALTFCWEQFDLGNSSPPANNANGPLFRSRSPVTSPTRTLPRMADILSGVATPWEFLPTVDRTLNFRVTARDNRANGGGVNADAMAVTVQGAPFFITSPNGGESLAGGCAVPVTWTIGGGSVAANVRIRLSTDGGNNFTTLVASTPNDGSADISLPCGATGSARLMVEAVESIFFDVSDQNFSIVAEAPVIAGSITGGSVDASCERSVPYAMTVTDDCAINAGDVSANVTLTTGNAVLGVPSITIMQVNPTTVSVTGSVLVSDLTSSPATVRIDVNASDVCGNASSRFETADVSDTTPPVVTCPADITVECTSHSGTPKSDPQLIPFFSGVSAMDNCDPSPSIGNDAPDDFPLGDTVVTFAATDASGNSGSCTATVTVVDTTPPEITASVTPNALWPPNHKMVDIVAMVAVTDICDPNPTFVLTSITSDEPDEGLGDGDHPDDIQGDDVGTPDLDFAVRSERSGLGDGRVYTILYTASDASGNTAQAAPTVVVPHSRNGRAFAANGFSADGRSFEAGAELFGIVIPADQNDGGASGCGVIIENAGVLVGNTVGTISSRNGSEHGDFDGDGLHDLVVFFTVPEAREIAENSDVLDGPVGLHFFGCEEASYLVPDIFALGPPVGSAVAVGETAAPVVPELTGLIGIFPTPLNPSATVTFDLVERSDVQLEVFTTSGSLVRTLRSGSVAAGRHQIQWDGRNDNGLAAGSGVYIVRLVAGGRRDAMKAVIVK